MFLNKIFKKKNSEIKKFYFCPHHPKFGKGKFKINCFFRKPNPGMILKCIKEYNLDLNSSIMIGDKISDKIASDRANVKFYYKNKGNLFNQIKKII